MSRQRALAAVVLSASLLLSACSRSEPAGHPAAGVGSVVHIGHYTQVFAGPLPASPARAAVVEDFRRGQVLWTKSQTAQHLVPSARDYVTGQALSHLAAVVKFGRARHRVPAGLDRLFSTRVTAMTGRSATVATCDDDRKFRQEDPRTGKADAASAASPAEQYLSETWQMARHSGHWAISRFSLALLPSPSAEPCQPGMAGYRPVRQPDMAALLRGMKAALRKAASVHISGTISQAGHSLLNLGITRAGEFSGQISEQREALTVLGTHGHSYLKINAGFLRITHLPATACGRFCGKYVQTPALQPRGMLAGLMALLTHPLTSTPARQFRYFGEVITGGHLAWLLQDSHRNSVYIAARGTPYLLREVAAPPAEGSVNMTQWNAVRIPGPPPPSQLVSISQLRALGLSA